MFGLCDYFSLSVKRPKVADRWILVYISLPNADLILYNGTGHLECCDINLWGSKSLTQPCHFWFCMSEKSSPQSPQQRPHKYPATLQLWFKILLQNYNVLFLLSVLITTLMCFNQSWMTTKLPSVSHFRKKIVTLWNINNIALWEMQNLSSFEAAGIIELLIQSLLSYECSCSVCSFTLWLAFKSIW